MTQRLFRIMLPYCLDRQEDGSYVVLNRDYKPLGFATNYWVRYDDYPVAYRIKRLTARQAAKISCHGSEDLDRIYLYNDGCNPANNKSEAWKAYVKRLDVLRRLPIEVEVVRG
jgi:hypothetical protein